MTAGAAGDPAAAAPAEPAADATPPAPPAPPQYWAVVVPECGPAEARPFADLDGLVAGLRAAAGPGVQAFAFRGARLATTRPPRHLLTPEGERIPLEPADPAAFEPDDTGRLDAAGRCAQRPGGDGDDPGDDPEDLEDLEDGDEDEGEGGPGGGGW